MDVMQSPFAQLYEMPPGGLRLHFRLPGVPVSRFGPGLLCSPLAQEPDPYKSKRRYAKSRAPIGPD